PAMGEGAGKLESKPKYVVSSTRKDFPWANSHHIAGDLRTGVQELKDATPAGVLLGSVHLATELDRLDLIDEYVFLVHPRIAGHGPTLYQSGLPGTRRLHRHPAGKRIVTRGGATPDPGEAVEVLAVDHATQRACRGAAGALPVPAIEVARRRAGGKAVEIGLVHRGAPRVDPDDAQAALE